jgi:hypothetical protein
VIATFVNSQTKNARGEATPFDIIFIMNTTSPVGTIQDTAPNRAESPEFLPKMQKIRRLIAVPVTI